VQKGRRKVQQLLPVFFHRTQAALGLNKDAVDGQRVCDGLEHPNAE